MRVINLSINWNPSFNFLKYEEKPGTRTSIGHYEFQFCAFLSLNMHTFTILLLKLGHDSFIPIRGGDFRISQFRILVDWAVCSPHKANCPHQKANANRSEANISVNTTAPPPPPPFFRGLVYFRFNNKWFWQNRTLT